MSKKYLVTGGCGFIGSFVVDRLISGGDEVRIFDNIEEQVHGGNIPEHVNEKAELFKGDVRNRDQLKEAVEDVDAIFHLAAAVGVGQSMYQISKYTEVNVMGTANLLDVLANENHSVKKILVASSMSNYGEGLHQCESCGITVKPKERSEAQLLRGDWEHFCDCGNILTPMPTHEGASMDSTSVYALTKKMQEEMTLAVGKAYGIPAVALRFFNVYGPRQSLNNPYTGVTAIFMSRLKNGNQPVIYEDGNQTRDFISVHDLALANVMAMESNAANYEVFNVGSGRPVSIKEVAETLANVLDVNIQPQITKKFRKGDIRHCFANNTKIIQKLGWEPKISFEEGMRELVAWSSGVEAEDKFEAATEELKSKGLM